VRTSGEGVKILRFCADVLYGRPHTLTLCRGDEPCQLDSRFGEIYSFSVYQTNFNSTIIFIRFAYTSWVEIGHVDLGLFYSLLRDHQASKKARERNLAQDFLA